MSIDLLWQANVDCYLTTIEVGSVCDEWNISVVICDTDIYIVHITVNQVMVGTVKLSK
jgi:hypothetical protein